MQETTVNVRYMVDDVETAVTWYTTHLGFTPLSNAAPAFADVTRGRNDIVSGPGGSQILIEDPSGNLVELFQPAAHRRA
jgi:hypothetical protein